MTLHTPKVLTKLSWNFLSYEIEYNDFDSIQSDPLVSNVKINTIEVNYLRIYILLYLPVESSNTCVGCVTKRVTAAICFRLVEHVTLNRDPA